MYHIFQPRDTCKSKSSSSSNNNKEQQLLLRILAAAGGEIRALAFAATPSAFSPHHRPRARHRHRHQNNPLDCSCSARSTSSLDDSAVGCRGGAPRARGPRWKMREYERRLAYPDFSARAPRNLAVGGFLSDATPCVFVCLFVTLLDGSSFIPLRCMRTTSEQNLTLRAPSTVM